MDSQSSPPVPKITVEPPVSHRTFGEEAREGKVFLPIKVVSGDSGSSDVGGSGVPSEKIAVLVCHGMGQQVAFEHIDMIARTIRRRSGIIDERNIRVKFAEFGDQTLPRAEIDLPSSGDRKREVHVYEAYWAPLTEGKVSAFAVTRFLFDAGFRGMQYAWKGSFDRWMMGGRQTFTLRFSTFVSLAFAFLVVCSGLLIYGALGSVLAARAVQTFFGSGTLDEPVIALVDRILLDLLRSPLLLVSALAFLLLVTLPPVGVGMWAWRVVGGTRPPKTSSDSTPKRRNPRLGKVISSVVAFGIALWTIITGVVLTLHVGVALFPSVQRPGWLTDALSSGGRLVPESIRSFFSAVAAGSPGLPLAVQLFFLVVAVLACLWIRSFYIQYLGDVAVYLASHKLNAFHELRSQIKKIGMDVGCALYRALDKKGQKFEYDGVVVVGHSLGSVVAYDTLNSILNLDRTLEGSLGAEERTLRLMTFGSPLDKSAFIFRTQKEGAEVREALAAAVQPLIQPPSGIRTIPWVNIYSPMDPVSGMLHYYDPPQEERNGRDRHAGHEWVNDKPDPQANIYGQAHTSYWENDLLAEELYSAVTAPLRNGTSKTP